MTYTFFKIMLSVAATFSFCIINAQTGPPWPTLLTVAQDGTGNHKTIQEAINAVRALAPRQVKIVIKKGVYHEKVVIPSWATNISLIGESRDSAIITNNDHTGKDYPGKDITGQAKFITFTSYTLLVQGNDFTAENLTNPNDHFVAPNLAVNLLLFQY